MIMKKILDYDYDTLLITIMITYSVLFRIFTLQ